MKENGGNLDVKLANRIKVATYLTVHGHASRQELATALNFSLPTIFSIVNDLMEKGLICESGEYGSTGGRKAKRLTIREGACCVVGADIAKSYVQLVLLDLNQKIQDQWRVKLPFADCADYYREVGRLVDTFLERNRLGTTNPSRLLGVGISVPGSVDNEQCRLEESLILGVENLDLMKFAKQLSYPVCFGQDSENVVLAEVADLGQNLAYLSLNDVVSGGAFLHREIYTGDRFKAVLFGHMTIVPGGKPCYCGKKGCVNAYCSAQVLTENGELTLEQFFREMENGNRRFAERWDEYLEHLAVTAANIRMVMDCDLIVGGEVSVYLERYMALLEEKTRPYLLFDQDLSFVRLSKYKGEAFAVGAAKLMINKSFLESDVLLSEGSDS